MDYEQKYKALLAQIEAVKKDPQIGLKKGDYYNGYVQTGIRHALDYILHEESDDERIRWEIISYLNGKRTKGEADPVIDSWVSYLEEREDNNWKPSCEQMTILSDLIEESYGSRRKELLLDLYNELKKNYDSDNNRTK